MTKSLKTDRPDSYSHERRKRLVKRWSLGCVLNCHRLRGRSDDIGLRVCLVYDRWTVWHWCAVQLHIIVVIDSDGVARRIHCPKPIFVYVHEATICVPVVKGRVVAFCASDSDVPRPVYCNTNPIHIWTTRYAWISGNIIAKDIARRIITITTPERVDVVACVLNVVV